MLAGKGMTLVGTDFMKYETPLRYDLIIMNPPFATGVQHVLKAWDMVAPGGHLVALLNADTVMHRDTAAIAALRTTIIGGGLWWEEGATFVTLTARHGEMRGKLIPAVDGWEYVVGVEVYRMERN